MMKKIALIILLVMVCVAPAYAQDQQPSSDTTAPPLVASALLDKADALITAKNYDQAVLELSLFILVNPTYSVGYYARAQSYLDMNNLDNALQDVDRAIATSPANITPQYGSLLYSMRGQIDTLQQNADEAIKDFSQSITFQPSLFALANRGIAYMNKNNFQLAHTDFDSAITLDSSNPALFVYRGNASEALKDATTAGADYVSFFNAIQPKPTIQSPIQAGQAATLQIDQGVVTVLPFSAKAKQYISAAAITQSGDVDPLLALIDTQGTPLTGDDNSGGNSTALILNYQVAADGNYGLMVGHSINGFTGTVQIRFQISDEPIQVSQ